MFSGPVRPTSATHDVPTLAATNQVMKISGMVDFEGPLTDDQIGDLVIMDTLSVPIRRLPLNAPDVWSIQLNDLRHFSWLVYFLRGPLVLVESFFVCFD